MPIAIGPMCEAVIDGRYYWCHSSACACRARAPSDLRDVVWMRRASLLATGAKPRLSFRARYPGSEADGAALFAGSEDRVDEGRAGDIHAVASGCRHSWW